MNEADGLPPDAWRITVYLALPHPARAEVWLVADGTLPVFTRPGVASHLNTAAIWRASADSLGCPVNLLHCPIWHEVEAQRQVTALYLVEPAGAALPAGGQWAGAAQVVRLAAALPDPLPAALAALMAELASGQVPSQRPAWARPGWYPQATAWIDGQLARLGTPRTGEIVPVKSWSLSCLLRIPAGARTYYFKATVDLPLFVNEGVVMQTLAGLYPAHVPRPVAVEVDRRWMLLPDLGEVLSWQPSLAVEVEMLVRFGQLQIDSAGHVAALLAAGCLDRRLPQLAGQIGPLLAHPLVKAYLTAGQLARLEVLVPTLREQCARLATYRIPHTLMHGDMHGNNVAGRDGQYFFFDWTDACIAHPFLDMLVIHYAGEEARQAALQSSYLALWTQFEPLARVQEAWVLAQPLMCLHHAVSYLTIVAGIEPDARPDLDWGIAYWLEKLLAFFA